MPNLKFLADNKEWKSAFREIISAIKNRLRKDKNLSDVENVVQARKNLEIIGDNNHTHYHDDRYIPLIDATTASVEQEASDRDAAIRAEAQIRAAADASLTQSINNVSNSIGKCITSISISNGVLTFTRVNGQSGTITITSKYA